jgi:hypothetical protein
MKLQFDKYENHRSYINHTRVINLETGGMIATIREVNKSVNIIPCVGDLLPIQVVEIIITWHVLSFSP